MGKWFPFLFLIFLALYFAAGKSAENHDQAIAVFFQIFCALMLFLQIPKQKEHDDEYPV